MRLRKHQEKARRVAAEVADSVAEQVTVAHVTPGGGKTLMASLFAHELLRLGAIERVVIVCPRDSLRTQMVDGFTAPSLDLNQRVMVWDPKQSSRRLIKDTVGLVTTYQTAMIYRSKLEKIVASKPTLLILDEGHHLAGPEEEDDHDGDYAAWFPSIAPAAKAAAHTLLMTGTIYHSSGERIPLVEYDDEDRPIVHIRYTRQDALEEGAVLPIEFRMWDGDATFKHRGEVKETSISDANGRDERMALNTALRDIRGAADGEEKGYVLSFLDNALSDWQLYRTQVYRSKAIIVCVTQDMARWVHAQVADSGYAAVLAISNERDAAKRIQRFRKGTEGDVLVTVGMAYEGLDVPDASHLLLLTNKRARSWLDQATARVTRVNSDCEVNPSQQFGYVYLQDDKRARHYVDEMMAEQDEAVPEHSGEEASVGRYRGPSTFVPMSATATHRREGSDREGRLPEHLAAEVERIRAAVPEFAHLSFREILNRRAAWKETFGSSR